MKRMFSYLSARDVSNLPKAVPSLRLLQLTVSGGQTCRGTPVRIRMMSAWPLRAITGDQRDAR